MTAVRTSMICPFGGTELVLQVDPPEGSREVTPEVLDGVRTILSNRIDALGVRNAAVFSEESNQVRIQLPEFIDPEQAERVLGNRGQLSFRPQKPGTEVAVLQMLLAERQLLRDEGANDVDHDPSLRQEQIREVNEAIATLFEPAAPMGDQLRQARAQQMANLPGWEITIEFNEQGAQAFADLTRQIAGTGRTLGIFLDDELISAPTVGVTYAETGITGGSASISGNFTAEEAFELELQLKSGVIPAPTEIVSIESVNRDANCEL